LELRQSSQERRDSLGKWNLWIHKISRFLKKKYSVPTPTVRLLEGETFSDYDKKLEKMGFRHARGLFIHDWETDGVRDASIFIMIGNPAKTETKWRIASIFLHEYHHYLDWRQGGANVPEQVPDLPYRWFAGLSRLERWVWYRAAQDLKEFRLTLDESELGVSGLSFHE